MSVRLLMVVLVLVMMTWFGLSSKARSTFTGDYSSFSPAPSGLLGLYEVAAAMGKGPTRLVSDFERLPTKGAIVSVSPRREEGQPSSIFLERPLFTKHELDVVEGWVVEGNTLVVFHPSPTELLARFGLKQESASSEGEVDIEGDDVEGDWPPATQAATLGLSGLRWLDGVTSVDVEESVRSVRVAAAEGKVRQFVPLLIDTDGGVVSAEVLFGSGRFVWVGSPYMASNQGLTKRDNGVFVARLLERESKVYFDEYHHGFRHKRSMSGYLRERGLWLVGCQLLLLLLCVWWRVGGGFGALEQLERPLFRRTRGDVSALGLIYLRGKHYRHALEVLLKELESVLVEVRGLPAGISGARLVKSLRGSGREAEAAELAEVMSRLSMERGKLRRGESVALAKRISRYTEMLRGEGQ